MCRKQKTRQQPGVPKGAEPPLKKQKGNCYLFRSKIALLRSRIPHAPAYAKNFIVFTKTACVSLAAPNISRNRQQPPYTTAA
jgi:hypothetical protein